MKNWKRIVTLILALAMALALSAPGFAAGAGYSDVAPDAWYAGAVDYVTEHKLMGSVGNGRFAPSGDTSLAMLVTTLWRMEGEPVVNYLMQFSDVPGGAWYTEAVRWAASEQIVQDHSSFHLLVKLGVVFFISDYHTGHLHNRSCCSCAIHRDIVISQG